MILYDNESREQFFDVEEIGKIWNGYENFSARRGAFEKEPKFHAELLLKDIQEMKRVPLVLRYALPNHLKVRNGDLNQLEEKCKQHI